MAGKKKKQKKTRKKRVILDIDRDTLYDLLIRQGMTMREVAEKYDVTHTTIARRCIAYGIKTGKEGKHAGGREKGYHKVYVSREALERYLQEGLTIGEIERILDVSETTIYNRCKEWGLPYPSVVKAKKSREQKEEPQKEYAAHEETPPDDTWKKKDCATCRYRMMFSGILGCNYLSIMHHCKSVFEGKQVWFSDYCDKYEQGDMQRDAFSI